MPLGKEVGEIILRSVLEEIFLLISYWTGFVVLEIGTFGSIRIAPLKTIYEKNRKKRKWYQIDWSIWLVRPKKGRALKAEFACLVGLVVLIGIGVYFWRR